MGMSFDRKDALSLTAAVAFMMAVARCAARVGWLVGWLVAGRVDVVAISRPDVRAVMQIEMAAGWSDRIGRMVSFLFVPD